MHKMKFRSVRLKDRLHYICVEIYTDRNFGDRDPCLAVYTVELATKMIAYGVALHANAYLRDPWCMLDAVVVCSAWLPLLTPISVGNLGVLRAFRALRPLRALRSLPGMPALVQSILYALPRLANVLVLLAFLVPYGGVAFG